MNILFYDIEVYPHDSFVVFMDNQENKQLFHNKNNFEGLDKFIQGKTLIGYNNYFYDDHVLNYMILGRSQKQIKQLNDDIISGKQMRGNYSFNSLDCFQQIDVGFPSLKKIEGNMGKMILESSVPFDLPREMTKDEYRDAVAYCTYDVQMTREVYNMRIYGYFKPKESLVEMVGKGQKWNTTTLSANALLGNKTLTKWSDIRLTNKSVDPEGVEKMLSLVPEEVRELWRTKDKGKVTVNDFDCSIEFGFGGLHGVNNTKKRFNNVKLLDVASMYPNIILNINALGNATPRYKEILDERISIKHTDKIKSDALKLILNSVYGNLKNQYSSLYNPKSALSVCIYGQVALYELGKRLSEVATIVQLNTDGVAFVPHGEYKAIWKQWEKDFNLNLEEENYDQLIQKDVNNYIGVKDGKVVKCKGGDVGRYFAPSYFKNNSARIVDLCLVEYLVNNRSIIDTLIENLDKPELFQYIIQAGHTYKGTFDEEGNQYNKINRIFPTKKGELCLYKKRHDEGLVRFPDLPEKMYVWNDEVDKLEGFEKIIDLNHYVQVINKKLERWS